MTNLATPASFRDQSDLTSPTFWNGPIGTKLRYAMSILYDGLNDSTEYAVQAQAPSIAPSDALPFASIDRQIARGYQETEASIRARVIQWLDRWPYSGRSTGAILFARGWILPQLPEMTVVTNSGTWWGISDGVDPMPPGQQTVSPVTVQTLAGGGVQPWNWDGLTGNWWRSWLIVYATTTPWITEEATWGSGDVWGDPTGSWGFAAPASVATGLSAAVRFVKRTGCWYPYIIVPFSNALFQPTTVGAGAPDGTYGRWSKIVNGQYVASRNSGARYIGVRP